MAMLRQRVGRLRKDVTLHEERYFLSADDDSAFGLLSFFVPESLPESLLESVLPSEDSDFDAEPPDGFFA